MVAYHDRKKGGISSDGNEVPNNRRLPEFFFPARWGAPFKGIVNEHHTMRNKTIVPDFDQFTDKSVRLNFCVVSDDHAFLDLDKRADKTVFPDLCSKDIDGFHDPDVFAKDRVPNADFEQRWLLRMCHLARNFLIELFY